MRNCPICNEPDKKLIFAGYDRQNMSLFSCDGCGHRYIDSANLSQEWFNEYYAKLYRTDDKPYSADRYQALAWYVEAHAKEALDIGGKDGELKEYFKIPYDAIGVGEQPRRRYDCVILSHTLEHVYDMPAMMQIVKKALVKDGLLVIEVPIHITYKKPVEYDYHWQHINKFRPMDLMELLVFNQYSIVEFCKLPDYREYECWRIAGRL